MDRLTGERTAAAVGLVFAVVLLVGCSAPAPSAAPTLVTALHAPEGRSEQVQGAFVLLDDGCVGIRAEGESGRVVVWQSGSTIVEERGEQRIDLLNGSVEIGEAAVDAWGVVEPVTAFSDQIRSEMTGVECLGAHGSEIVVLTSLEDFLFQQ